MRSFFFLFSFCHGCIRPYFVRGHSQAEQKARCKEGDEVKRVIAGAAFRKYFPQTTLFFFLLVDLFFPLHKTWAASIVAKYDDEAKKKKKKRKSWQLSPKLKANQMLKVRFPSFQRAPFLFFFLKRLVNSRFFFFAVYEERLLFGFLAW